MKRKLCLVDTTIWVDFFNGTETRLTNYLHDSLGKTHILVGDLIIAEVLQGFRQDSDFERAHVMLTKFTIVNMLNPVIAIQSARNYRFLRQKGITVRKTIDSIIATYCIENNHELLHNDSDFNGYEKLLGLRVIHP